MKQKIDILAYLEDLISIWDERLKFHESRNKNNEGDKTMHGNAEIAAAIYETRDDLECLIKCRLVIMRIIKSFKEPTE